MISVGESTRHWRRYHLVAVIGRGSILSGARRQDGRHPPDTRATGSLMVSALSHARVDERSAPGRPCRPDRRSIDVAARLRLRLQRDTRSGRRSLRPPTKSRDSTETRSETS